MQKKRQTSRETETADALHPLPKKKKKKADYNNPQPKDILSNPSSRDIYNRYLYEMQNP
jgi:hypothetical protein